MEKNPSGFDPKTSFILDEMDWKIALWRQRCDTSIPFMFNLLKWNLYKQILKSASSNVISSFCLNESYDFGDSEQMKILEWTEKIFKNFSSKYIVSALARFYPDFIIRHGISRKILTTFRVSTYDPKDDVWNRRMLQGRIFNPY